MISRKLATLLPVCFFLLISISCVEIPTPDGGDTSARSIEGYWLVGDMTHDDILPEASQLDFLHLRPTHRDGTTEHFEVLDACDESVVLATGALTADGRIHVTNEEGNLVYHLAEFVDDHEFEVSESDGDTRFIGRRIEKPECASLPEIAEVGVHVQPLQHVNDDDTVLVGSEQPDDQDPNGLAHLNAARGSRLPLGQEVDQPTDSTADPMMICQTAGGDSTNCPANPDAGHAGIVECSVQEWTESRQSTLTDVIVLGDLEDIYPGALLQGDSFAAGSFTPITIPRSEAIFTMTGLSIPGSPNTPPTVVTRANVADAIHRLLQDNEIQGTAADFSLDTQQVYSSDQFALSLGFSASATGMPASISGNLEFKNDSVENAIVLKFFQVYYSISMETPVHPYSAFADGVNFDDPDNQIGDGNPPLYVSNVKYGRQIFFFLRSSYGAELVKAAVSAAASAEAASGMASADLTYQSVMSKTSVAYVVRGGSASSALAAVDSATPDEMYEAVKAAIADAKAAEFSLSSPGVPISYTLRYLTDNSKAMTSYATTYDRRDCRTYPAHDYNYRLKIINPVSRAWVNLDTDSEFTNTGVIAGPYKGGNHNLDLNSHLDMHDHTLILKVYSECTVPPHANGEFQLYVDGARRWTGNFYRNFFECRNPVDHVNLINDLMYKASIEINGATGKVNVVSELK